MAFASTRLILRAAIFRAQQLLLLIVVTSLCSESNDEYNVAAEMNRMTLSDSVTVMIERHSDLQALSLDVAANATLRRHFRWPS